MNKWFFFVPMWNLLSIVIVALFTGAYMGLIFYYRDLFKRVKPFVGEAGTPVTNSPSSFLQETRKR
jgi:hypothetical protein